MRVVVILNKSYPVPAQLNAVGHLGAGLFKLVSNDVLQMRTFKDEAGLMVSALTDLPLIVLEANSSAELLSAHQSAYQGGIAASAFFNCMRTGTPQAQEEFVVGRPVADQDYIALALIADKAALRKITKPFPLYI